VTANRSWTMLASAVCFSAGAGGYLNPGPASLPHNVAQIALATVRDSSGIRIVEYPNLAPKEPWFISRPSFVFDSWSRISDAFTIDSFPFRDIGGDGASVELKDPFFASAVELHDGEFMIADKDRLVRIAAGGRVLSTSGRPGRGPGEFEDIRSMCVFNRDTLLVIDKLGTASLWDARGAHIRTIAEKDPFVWSSCDGRGHLVSVARPRLATIDPNGLERRSLHWLARPSGDRIQSLGLLPAPVMAGLLSWQPSLGWTRGELVVARGRVYELAWHHTDGRVRQIVRLTRKVENISDGHWQKILSDAVPAGSSSENRTRILQVMGRKPNAAFPAHGPILVDTERRVWVADFADPSSLTVFAYDGSLLGRVQLRSALGTPRPTVVGVGANYIQVREQDTDGFIHLRFYRLRPRG